MRASLRAKILVLTTIFLPHCVASAAVSKAHALGAFLNLFHCPLATQLEFLESHDAKTQNNGRDRFVIIANEDSPSEPNYVQCIVAPDDSETYCEASSGFYFDPPGKPRTAFLPKTSVAILAKLGFSTDNSKGNFAWRRKNTGAPDFDALSDFMLTVLHDVFGAQPYSHVVVVSPMTKYKQIDLKPKACPLVG